MQEQADQQPINHDTNGNASVRSTCSSSDGNSGSDCSDGDISSDAVWPPPLVSTLQVVRPLARLRCDLPASSSVAAEDEDEGACGSMHEALCAVPWNGIAPKLSPRRMCSTQLLLPKAAPSVHPPDPTPIFKTPSLRVAARNPFLVSPGTPWPPCGHLPISHPTPLRRRLALFAACVSLRISC